MIIDQSREWPCPFKTERYMLWWRVSKISLIFMSKERMLDVWLNHVPDQGISKQLLYTTRIWPLTFGFDWLHVSFIYINLCNNSSTSRYIYKNTFNKMCFRIRMLFFFQCRYNTWLHMYLPSQIYNYILKLCWCQLNSMSPVTKDYGH